MRSQRTAQIMCIFKELVAVVSYEALVPANYTQQSSLKLVLQIPKCYPLYGSIDYGIARMQLLRVGFQKC